MWQQPCPQEQQREEQEVLAKSLILLLNELEPA